MSRDCRPPRLASVSSIARRVVPHRWPRAVRCVLSRACMGVSCEEYVVGDKAETEFGVCAIVFEGAGRRGGGA